MRRLAIFHYNPIELFPPILNLLNYLGKESKFEIVVYTTHPPDSIALFKPDVSFNVKVVRAGKYSYGEVALKRIFSQSWYHFYTLLHSVIFKPHIIFYYETFSSVIPLFLKQYIFKDVHLGVHYHEYMGPADYKRSSLLYSIYRREKRLLPKTFWISHTNDVRLEMFKKDLGAMNEVLPTRIMPNYPPAAWASAFAKKAWCPGVPLRIVYVGAIGLDGMFLAEMIRWVETLNGRCIFDVYSNQSTDEVGNLIKKEKVKHTSLKQPVPYFRIPEILKDYDVGVILYKGENDNFRYNAPNKLFEYLNVGLDVWFPKQMEGVVPYIRTDIHPLVMQVDFETLNNESLAKLYGNVTTEFSGVKYQAEDVYEPLKLSMENLID